VLVFAVPLLAMAVAADAQQVGKLWRLGQLDVAADAARLHWWNEFRSQLRELGYIEGQNLAVEARSAEGKPERLPALAADLVRLNVDVIVVASTAGALAAKRATEAIPIVAVNVGDPVGTGLVASLARPGGNVTGLTFLGTDLTGKQLALLKEAIPSAGRVAIFANPDNASHAPRLREAEVAAHTLKTQVHVFQVRGPAEIDSAFAAVASKRLDALLLLADPLFTQQSGRLAQLSVRARLPAIYGLREYVERGGLMSYGVSFPALFRRAAAYVDKILKGAKPADIPVEQPTTFELVINRKTARALELTLPPSLLLRADQIID
jgi:putative tryptophan/tyrosine transport system substrate-binding protein